MAGPGASAAVPRGVLLDLDGTLLDSIPMIEAGYRHTFAAFGREVSREEVRGAIGVPLACFLARFAADEAEVGRMAAVYRAWFDAHHDRLVRAFDGVREAMDVLARRGVALGVVTSKRHDAARRGLRLIGLEAHFEVLVGADDVARHKPEPEPVLRGVELLGRAPGECAYVGDTVHDLRAARAAGCRTVACTWGAGARDALRDERPDLLLEAPAQLLAAAEF